MSETHVDWYAALVRPNSTEIAIRNLKRQGFEVFCPRELETRRRGGKFVDVVRPVFPGYVFVSARANSSALHKVNSTYGVARLVSFGSVPALVPSELMDLLLKRCGSEGFLLPPDQFASGDKVTLTSGPFAKFVATVERVAPDKRVWVLLEFLGGQSRVMTEAEHLRVTP